MLIHLGLTQPSLGARAQRAMLEKRNRAGCAAEREGTLPSLLPCSGVRVYPGSVRSPPTPVPPQAGDALSPRDSVAHPSPATAPRKERRGQPVPQQLASAAAAAAGAAGEAAFGGGQKGVFPGQAAGQRRAAASWAMLSGYLQGGGGPAKHQCRKRDLVPLATESRQGHMGCSTEQPPSPNNQGNKVLHSKQTQFAGGA